MVIFDRDCEYYGRHTKMEQSARPLKKFIKKLGIVPQYTMPGTPDQNGIAKRKN